MKNDNPKYNSEEIEAKWQKVWAETGLNKTPIDPKDKFYNLVMFPYPSGDLHIGHWYNFGPADTIGRFNRMHGKDVLQPNGYDSFGLPAENAAIKKGVPAEVWTDENVARFHKQYLRLGGMYDLDKEIDTSKPEYYRWTQWLFLRMFKAGKAYQNDGLVNWCPKDMTALANEQVIHGECERCGTKVERKKLKQWYFKITDYADALLNDMDELEWPERVKTMQRNWIGRSEGAQVRFPLDNGSNLEVYTTRPDTLYGATFLVLAPEHELVGALTTEANRDEVEKYVELAGAKTDVDRLENKDKTGVFTGSYATNPVNGEKLPIWIADYVLMGYGTGAIMAVPAHDQRDFEFAKRYDIAIKQVVMPCANDSNNPPRPEFEEVVRDTVIVHLRDKSTGKFALLNWHESLEGITTAIMGGIEDGQSAEEAALAEIREEAALTGVEIVRKLRWVTAARYCASHKKQNRKAIAQVFLAEVDNLEGQGEIPENERKLHALIWVEEGDVLKSLTPDHQKLVWQQLREEAALVSDGTLLNSDALDGMDVASAKNAIAERLQAEGSGEAKVQYKIRDWLISRQRYWGAPIPIIYCDKCGVVPVPEDQLPVVLPLGQKFDESGQSPLVSHPDYMRTPCPSCGGDARRETDTMDTFVDSSWYFLRYPNPHYTDGPFDPEAVKKWLPVDNYMGGIEHAILHLLYARFFTKFLKEEGLIDFNEPFKKLINQGMILGSDGDKMSKRKGNVVDPLEYVDKYGADAVRLYLMFMGPYEEGGPWDPQRFEGTYRFIGKVWDLFAGYEARGVSSVDETGLLRELHKTIRKVTADLEDIKFNTAIAAMMELTKHAAVVKRSGSVSTAVWREFLGQFALMLAPFTPHLAEELWQNLGQEESVHLQTWPKWDDAYLVSDTVTIVVQVNGKLRGEFSAAAGAGNDGLEAEARKVATKKGWLDGEPKKVIVVPGKLVNIVL